MYLELNRMSSDAWKQHRSLHALAQLLDVGEMSALRGHYNCLSTTQSTRYDLLYSELINI
jgi:hypothetical protein